MDVVIHEYGNGYRPTADGLIGGRAFWFRLMGGRWAFLVATEAATCEGKFWWHSPDEEVDFQAGGKAEPVFHDQSLPYFLDGLRAYLAHCGVPGDEQEAVLGEAERRAMRLFATGA